MVVKDGGDAAGLDVMRVVKQYSNPLYYVPYMVTFGNRVPGTGCRERGPLSFSGV